MTAESGGVKGGHGKKAQRQAEAQLAPWQACLFAA